MKLSYKAGHSRVRREHPLAPRRKKVVRRQARWGLLMLGTAALAFTALPALSSGSVRPAVATSHTKTVKPDFAYYNGKTINLIWASAIGSAPEWADILPLVDSYLHATINMTYNASGSGIPALDQAFSAAPDGLTIGGTGLGSMTTHLIYTADPFSFAIKKLVYVAASKGADAVLVACPGSGITSLKQLMTSTTLYSGLVTPNVGVDLEMTLLQQIYGHIGQILTGFTGSTLPQGCLAGDGDIAFLGDQQVLNAAGTGLVPGYVPLLQTGEQAAGGTLAFLNKEIPDYLQFIKEYPPKTKAGKRAMEAIASYENTSNPYVFLAAPPNTPQKYVLALQKAFASAMSQPEAKQLYLANNVLPGFFPGKDILPYVDQLLNKYLPIFQKYAADN
jgi:hypothetical protein